MVGRYMVWIRLCSTNVSFSWISQTGFSEKVRNEQVQNPMRRNADIWFGKSTLSKSTSVISANKTRVGGCEVDRTTI